MAKVLILLISILCFTQGCYADKTSLSILNMFSMDFGNIKVINTSKSMYKNQNLENKFMVVFGYAIIVNNKNYGMYIYLRPIKNITEEEITNYSKVEEIEKAATSFGMGDIYKEMLNQNNDVKELMIGDMTIKKYIAAWGSSITRDVLAYNFDIKNNPVFDSCLIEVFDVWPKSEELPKTLSVKYVDALIKNGDKRVSFYKVMDEVINTLKILDGNNHVNNKKEFIPKIDNLRFRKSPDLNAKVIRAFNKGEKLQLLETGKAETIDCVKGTWVKVKTDKGEIGWCFDAYLEEVK